MTPFGILIPAQDESAALRANLPRLLDGLAPAADLVIICNGCSDDSAATARALAGPRARVLTLPRPGKAAALRAGEAASPIFPRLYLDADVAITGPALNALAARLTRGDCDLVAPLLRADTTGASRLARWITETWMDTPHMRDAGFHCVLGLSAAGRAHWGDFPDLTNDDDFIRRQIPPDRARILRDIRAVIRPPLTFAAWVRVRERWLRGARELQPIAPAPRAPSQLGGLARAALRGRLPQVATYLAARALATSRAAWHPDKPPGWYRDTTSRAP